MERWGIVLVRLSFAIIFIWFGVLKPLGYSTAIPLVESTVAWLPLLEPATWVKVIGWWEVAIGVLFLFGKTIRLAIALLFLQMVGTFMPLVVLPEVVYQGGHIFLPTMEGQYIIKNIMIISAAVVTGGSIHRKKSDL
ncbi:DoxX family membrane protein [Lewinella sp. W8]|nr:DoxX family membrane protein [Lewinella sp. W8]